MLTSFLVYTLTAVVLSYLGWHANKREQRLLDKSGERLPFVCWEIVASIILFAIVAGARYKTGYDHYHYLRQYYLLRDGAGFTRQDFEPGFKWITQAFAACKAHEFFYFAFWGGLQLGLFYFAFRKNKPLLAWIPVVIMLGGYFVNWMNTIRQVVVECAFVAMVPLCTTSKRTLLCAAVALAFASIHFTAFLVVVFLGIMWMMRRVELSRPVMFAIYAGCVVLGVYPVWFTVVTHLSSYLQGTDYHKYIPLINDMVSGGYRFTNWGPNHILAVASQAMLLWFYPEVRKANPGDKSFKSFFDLMFIGLCMTNLLINTSHFVLRPFEYLTLCSIVVLAYTLKHLFECRKWLQFTMLAGSSLTITYIAVVKAVLVPTDINTPFLYNFLFWH